MLSKIIKTILLIIVAALWTYVCTCAWTYLTAPDLWMRALAGLLTIYGGFVAIVVSLIVALWWRKI